MFMLGADPRLRQEVSRMGYLVLAIAVVVFALGAWAMHEAAK